MGTLSQAGQTEDAMAIIYVENIKAKVICPACHSITLKCNWSHHQ